MMTVIKCVLATIEFYSHFLDTHVIVKNKLAAEY